MAFGLFKSKEEQERKDKKTISEEAEQKRRAEALNEQEERAKYDSFLAQVIFTPESKESYETRVGYKVEVIETNDRNKGLIFSSHIIEGYYLRRPKDSLEFKKYLIEALVETSYTDGDFYGLPVARKKGGPYR